MLFFDGMGAWWRVEAWWWIRLNAPEVLDSEVGFHPVGENIIHQNWDGGAPFTQPWKPYIYMYESNIWLIYIYIYHTRDDGSWVFRVTSTSPSVSLANIGRNNICSQEKPPKIKEIHGDWCFLGGAILGDFSTQIWSEGTGENRGTIFVKIGSNSPCC